MLVSNGNLSFVILNYDQLEWTTGSNSRGDPETGLGGKPAQVCHTLTQSDLFLGCLTSQQHAHVSQGQILSDMLICCHTEIEVADQTFYLTQSHYTDTGLTSPSVDPVLPGAWQGSHWSANFYVNGMTRPGKSRRKRDSNPRSSALKMDALTTRPMRR